jgi:5'-deoxynucleotidase YfbR-like HD superfamily hydrolase
LLILSKTVYSTDGDGNSLGACIKKYYTKRLNNNAVTDENEIEEYLSNRAKHEFDMMCAHKGKGEKGRLSRATVSKNSITRAFFVAYHLVNQLKALVTEGIVSLDDKTIVLNAVTNELFYDIFDFVSDEDKDSIIVTITDLVGRGTQAERLKKIKKQPFLFAQVCYMMGILSKANLSEVKNREKLIEGISDTLSTIWEDLNHYLFENGYEDCLSSEYRTPTYYGLLFLFRTVSIARILSGDVGHEEKFLKSLLLNRDLNLINRGFHIAYYVEKEHEYYLDNEEDPIDLVNSVLFDSLKDTNNPLRNLNAMTIISFYQNKGVDRVADGEEKAKAEYKAKVKKLISEVLVKKNGYNVTVMNYARNINIDLKKTDSSPYRSIIDSIFGLKQQDMKGWNCKNRKVNNSESVCDHIYGSFLVALIFLPESIKGTVYKKNTEYNGYSKHTILAEILLHDFGKYQNGDEATGLQGKNYLKKQEAVMQQFQYVHTFDGIYFPSDGFDVWKRYHDTDDINSILANEMTSIDMLITALKYKQNKKNQIDAKEWIDWADDVVNSALGKEVLNKVLDAFRDDDFINIK